MRNPFVRYARRKAIRRYSSPIPTGPAPLARVRSALVLMDPGMWYADGARNRMASFFKSRGIGFTVLEYTAEDLNWFGRLKYPKGVQPIGEEDLFVSLRYDDDFAAEYAAKSSRAFFKIGRHQLPPGDVYDLLIAPESGPDADAGEIFAKLTEVLKVIE